jgi:arsenite methyltransferase
MAGYTRQELNKVPRHAAEHAFGCGNPVAFSEMKEGQVVLDLGSGAGIDCLLAARKVGSRGKVIGLDMTPEMIEAARKNAAEVGAANVEFRLGEMEHMPVADSSVDWVISNCVINLSPDKPRVFAEAFRILRPGGNILISDIVANDLPESILKMAEAWSPCISGVIDEDSYLEGMRRVGFQNVKVVAKITYDGATISAFLQSDSEQGQSCGCCASLPKGLVERVASMLQGKVHSIQVSAKKPL